MLLYRCCYCSFQLLLSWPVLSEITPANEARSDEGLAKNHRIFTSSIPKCSDLRGTRPTVWSDNRTKSFGDLIQQLFQHLERVTGNDADLEVLLKLFGRFRRRVRYRNRVVGRPHEVDEMIRRRVQVNRKLTDTRVEIRAYDSLSHGFLRAGQKI